MTMIPSHTPQSGISLTLIEACLTAITIAVAFCMPRFAAVSLGRVERALGIVARRKLLAVVIPGATLLLLRLVMLPIMPIPLPFVPDDFSFLLAADTFASGRLANPTPPMWIHFESIHISMQPTYMSMYFPAQGLFMAAGKVLFGHPWFGILISGALFCSTLCWMLQAWLPPTWAFLGAMLAVLRLGFFSYWMNTYSGAALIAALGGALVLGASPRYMRSLRVRDSMLLAAGLVLLMLSRPYEGLLLCLPVAVVFIRWLVRELWPVRRTVLRSAALPLLMVVAGGSWLAYYDYRAFGNMLTLPYTVNRATYAIAPYYVWQHPHPEPSYHHAALRNFYEGELQTYAEIHKPFGMVLVTALKAVMALVFFAGIALLLPLCMLERSMKDRRIRLLVRCMLVLAPGILIEIYLIPHYLAPFTAVFYAIGIQCMRHLRVWRAASRPVGLALVRGCVLVCIVMTAVRLCGKPLHIVIREWPVSNWSLMWYGPEHFGTERAIIQEKLAQVPGNQLVLVRYAPAHDPMDEWVYNAADIDRSKVIWARDMDAASNTELIRYYHDRTVWLVQPDLETAKLSPYPGLPINTDSAQLAKSASQTLAVR